MLKDLSTSFLGFPAVAARFCQRLGSGKDWKNERREELWVESGVKSSWGGMPIAYSPQKYADSGLRTSSHTV